MTLKKTRTKTELKDVKDACKAQGFNYDDTKLSAVYDMVGNILTIDTPDQRLQAILRAKGFI